MYQRIIIFDMRTTVTLDKDVYEAAMHLSRTTGRRLGRILSELARKGLQPGHSVRRDNRSRFPVFQVPPDAPLIPASQIQEYIDEEGLF
jgi:hypothetical protein